MSRIKEYCCSLCDYRTGRYGNYARHIESDLHKRRDHFAGVNMLNYSEDEYGVEEQHPSSICQTLAVQPPVHDQEMTVDVGNDESSTCTSNYSLEESEEEGIFNTGPCLSPVSYENTEWFPFDSKVHMLLSVLYSSKTHRISDEVMTFVLYMLKECGVKDVPSLSRIKDSMKDNFDAEDMMTRCEDSDGNIAWIVKPSSMLKLQLANPNVARQVSRYPTIENSDRSTYQASGTKWKGMKFHWAQDKGTNFVTGQFVTFKVRGERAYGEVLQFFEKLSEKKMFVEVSVYADKSHSLLRNKVVGDNCLVKLNKLCTLSLDVCFPYDVREISSFTELIDDTLSALSQEETEKLVKGNSLWKGIPIVNVPINLFMDDLSANTSRRWAPVHAIQGQIAGLPLDDKTRGRNVKFFGLSEKMKTLDLMKPICEDIQRCKQSGIEAYDAFLKENVIITSDISLIVTDYQMMSLACNHMGASANKFCPKCLADESDPFRKWEARTREKTLHTINRLQIASDKTTIQRNTGIKSYKNPLWDFIDCHRDTPIGLLHFLYLGLAKQLIKFSLGKLDSQKKVLLECHLSSIDQSSFSHRINANSFFKFFDSRQGKDYKHYLQIAAVNMEFAGLDLRFVRVIEKLAMISKHVVQKCPPDLISKEIGEYLDLLKNTIPELGRKPKTHLCVHLADDIKAHGHPLQYSEDCFEKNHKAIRSSMAHQNGHARSRDTALQFVKNEVLCHVVSGGYIPVSNDWKCGSANVLSHGKAKQIHSFLGMTESEPAYPRMLKNTIVNQMEYEVDEVTLLQAVLTCGGRVNLVGTKDLKVTYYKKAVTRLGENACVGNFVLYMDDENNTSIGQVTRCLRIIWPGNCHQLVEIKDVNICNNGLHQLIKPSTRKSIIKVSCLQHIVHCIHDCKGGNCRLKEGYCEEKSEQEVVSVKCTFLKHSSSHDVYILNKCRLTHSFDKYLC